MRLPNVLIVDDEIKICEIIKKFLDRTGKFGNIVFAESASIALLKIRNEDFDLAIIDYNMPNKKGTDLIEIMKSDFRNAKLKIILMSGYIDHTAVNLALSEGVRNILVKPFSRTKLLEAIEKALDIKLLSKGL